jgi:uncharacterized protein YbgA (DUF1722 family)/uncharacterized protein YbbK (DUF523 family)
MGAHVTFLPVCPEVAIGLGVPRDPVRLVAAGGGAVALRQPKTGLDVTERMRAFSAAHLEALGPVDGFLLKGRSPSCGIAQVRIHAADGSRVERKGRGLFAQAVLDRHPDVAVEEEGRLADFAIRDHFFTRIFASARLREVRSMAALVRFQATHKLLLLSHRQAAMRALGRIVANADGLPFGEVHARYANGFARALTRPARAPARIDVFEHAFGHLSDRLAPRERSHFLELLRRYRAARIPVGAVTTLLRSWAERFDVSYLVEQVLFEPYPEALVQLLDSGKGRGA